MGVTLPNGIRQNLKNKETMIYLVLAHSLARKCFELNSEAHLDGLKFDFEEAYRSSSDD